MTAGCIYSHLPPSTDDLAEWFKKRGVAEPGTLESSKWTISTLTLVLYFLTGEAKPPSAIKGTSNNYQFVTPAPYQVRDKLRPESSDIKGFWIPAFAGMTFLEVALNTEISRRSPSVLSPEACFDKSLKRLPKPYASVTNGDERGWVS